MTRLCLNILCIGASRCRAAQLRVSPGDGGECTRLIQVANETCIQVVFFVGVSSEHLGSLADGDEDCHEAHVRDNELG